LSEKHIWEWINSFDRIVLCLDNDEVGSKTARSIASLFDFNKVFKVDLARRKDANEYLEAGEINEFNKAWYGAKRFTPDNVLSTFHEIEESLADSNEDMLCTYPFKGLQDRLYGLHRGEVVVFKGDEGIGKTETFRALEHHILSTVEDSKIGILHLEEDEGTTVKAIATYEDQYPYVHPEYKTDPKEVMKAFKRAVKDKEDRVFIYESFDVEDENQLLDNIRFLVSACGCSFIFLDHITWLATGLENEDERKKLDRISQKLKLLAKELRFCLIMITHTNDEGKSRGSRNITKVANTVIHISRDKVAAIEEERNKMYYVIEKARAGGNTGPAGFAVFDKETMRLLDGTPVFEKFELVR
jgi:replicative DNA helicase